MASLSSKKDAFTLVTFQNLMPRAAADTRTQTQGMCMKEHFPKVCPMEREKRLTEMGTLTKEN